MKQHCCTEKGGEAISEIFVILCNYTILSGINGRILTII